KVATRPYGVFFEVPAQILSLDRPERCDEAPAMRARHFRLFGGGRLIQEPRSRGGAMRAIPFPEPEIRKFEHELFQRLGGGLQRRGEIRGVALAKGHENRINCRLYAAGGAA